MIKKIIKFWKVLFTPLEAAVVEPKRRLMCSSKPLYFYKGLKLRTNLKPKTTRIR